MKLNPALTKVSGEPWNDEFDNKTFRYWEQPNSQPGDYFIEVYVLVDDRRAAVVITRHGVSLDFADGSCLRTEINPGRLFPDLEKLGWDEIEKILKSIGGKGEFYDTQEVEVLYDEWVKLGKP